MKTYECIECAIILGRGSKFFEVEDKFAAHLDANPQDRVCPSCDEALQDIQDGYDMDEF